MSFHTLESRSIAFAAMCQAAYLVDKIANKGVCPDAAAFNASLKSIVRTERSAPLAIFGDHESLKLGYHTTIAQLDNVNGSRHLQITKYVAGLMALERKLSGNASSLNLLGERINQVNRQLTHFNIDDDSVLSNFDSIYRDLISNLGPKIQVNGNPTYLQQSHVQHKIRTLLLAGVRAAVLWRQVGGKRRQLLLSRKALVHQTKQNLQRI